MATRQKPTPVLTNPYLWALVLLATAVGGVVLGFTSAVGIFLGGVIGVVVLAVAARFLDELRSPGYENKIDPWRD